MSKTLKLVFGNKKSLIFFLVFGSIFISLLGFQEAKAITINSWDELGSGVFLCDDDYCLQDPPTAKTRWRFITKDHPNICDPAKFPESLRAWDDKDQICGEVGSIRIVGPKIVELFEDPDFNANRICFEKEEAYKLDNYKINGTGWNKDTDSLKVFTGGNCKSNVGYPAESTQKVSIPKKGFCPGAGWNPVTWLKCIGEYIISLPFRFAFFFLVVPIALLGLVVGFIFFLIVGLLSWVKTVFLSIPIIHAGIVDIGWTFTRDFANMFFILILVFIGLSTILKLREYEARKTLPILIIIALLINFSPVIVGLIVDISNIFTQFFLDKVGDIRGIWGLGGIWDASWTYFVESLKKLFTADGAFIENFPANIGSFIGIIVQGLALIVFYGFAALVFLVVVVLLFLRVIFLWILTIIAPIAFLSRVLPATKTVKAIFPGFLHWDEWWEKLLSWSIVAIPIGFFLYLSSWIMRNAGTLINQEVGSSTVGSSLNEEITASQAGTGITGQFASLFTDMLEPTVALVILWLGFMISVRTAPEGARWLMRGAEAGFKVAGRGGARFLRQAAPAVAKWEKYAFKTAGKGLGMVRRGLGKGWEKTGARIPGVRRVPGWVKRGAAAVPPVIKKVPGVPRVAERTVAAARVAKGKVAAAKGFQEAIKNFWGSLPPDLRDYLRRAPKELKDKIGEPMLKEFLRRSGIRKRRGEKICPSCGATVPEAADFCPSCGFAF